MTKQINNCYICVLETHYVHFLNKRDRLLVGHPIRYTKKNTNLGGSYIGYSQLSLVIQHLLKVGYMPGGICRVTMETLQN